VVIRERSLSDPVGSRNTNTGALAVIKGLLRFLAGILLLVAVIAAVNDVTRSMLAAQRLPSVTTYEHWSRLAPSTLTLTRNAVQRNTHPLVWDPALVSVLQLPAWGLFGLLGVLAAYAGRRRREVNVFAN
jgi:hypothetical protein